MMMDQERLAGGEKEHPGRMTYRDSAKLRKAATTLDEVDEVDETPDGAVTKASVLPAPTACHGHRDGEQRPGARPPIVRRPAADDPKQVRV